MYRGYYTVTTTQVVILLIDNYTDRQSDILIKNSKGHIFMNFMAGDNILIHDFLNEYYIILFQRYLHL